MTLGDHATTSTAACASAQVPVPTGTCTPKSTPESTTSYDDYRKRTQATRTKKIQSGKKAKIDVQKVTVQIGVVELEDDKLKKLKGRTLPLMIKSSCNAQDLLHAAVEKQAKHFK